MSVISQIGRAKQRAFRNNGALTQPTNHAGSSPAASAPRVSSTTGSAASLRLRMLRSLTFGARMIGGFIWWEMLLVKFIGQQRVDAGRMGRFIDLARRFRRLAIELGGVWIKLGQFLSSRVDIIPPEVVTELQDLQDAVPAEPSASILRTLERELGRHPNALFDDFDPTPIAAASFGQAYLATLKPDPANGAAVQRVVVKVQRSNLDAIVGTDLRALRIIANWLKRHKPIRKRANVNALVDEFAAGIRAELDYEQEARNAALFDANFRTDNNIRVPRVIAQYSTRRVIVLKNVEDIKVTDYDGLAAAGVSRKEVARVMFDSYLKQVFNDGFYHADPHPGNLFVQPLDVATARAWRVPVNEGTPFRLTYVDFGMMGAIDPAMIKELKEFIISISFKDARRWTAAAQRLGFFLPEADLIRIEQAVGAMFERFWGMGINDITNVGFDEMYKFSVQFKDLLSSLPFQVPQNVLYLGRAANILSGMMVALDPAFNPWQALLPFANGLTGGKGARSDNPLGGTVSLQDIGSEITKFARQTLQLPNQADAFLSRALNGQMEFRAQLNAASTQDLRRIETSVTRLTWAIVFVATLVCGTLLAINGFTGASIVCAIAGVVTLWRTLTLG
jgi:predicted unusual protein kinase regulating ubiquinone biosynthesis (AarF/ABC1/UbiB family)